MTLHLFYSCTPCHDAWTAWCTASPAISCSSCCWVPMYHVPPPSEPGLVLGEPFKPGSSTTPPPVVGDTWFVPMPGYSHTLGQGTGSTSGPDRTSLLCSSPQFLGGPMSVGWSEARPVPVYGWDQPAVWNGTTPQPSPGLSSRITCGYFNLSSLSPTFSWVEYSSNSPFLHHLAAQPPDFIACSMSQSLLST
jgi:hypothetical protein